MAWKKYKDRYILDSIDSILNLRLPAEIEMEKLILSLILSGRQQKEIFSGLDSGCFYVPEHSKMFVAAAELYEAKGTVPFDEFCAKVDSSYEKLKEEIDFREENEDFQNLCFVIPFLQLLKIKRAVVFESVNMIYNALDNYYDGDDLIDDCNTFGERVKQRGVTRIKDPNLEDWFVRDAGSHQEKYLVKKGKNGLPDYCAKDGKFVSEPKMFLMGYKRVSIPKAKALSEKEEEMIQSCRKNIDGLL